MDAMEFAKQWRGDLRSLEFPSPRPMLPAETVSFLHYAGLPKAFRIRHAEDRILITIGPSRPVSNEPRHRT